MPNPRKKSKGSGWEQTVGGEKDSKKGNLLPVPRVDTPSTMPPETTFWGEKGTRLSRKKFKKGGVGRGGKTG